MSIEQAKEVLRIEAEGITALLDQIDADFDKAVTMIMACSARVVITGIGKSGIIGQKIAATMNSTGTPALFLHPVEAMHGDLGMVDPQDVILAISYSGETAELSLLIPNLKKRGAKIIAMTGNPGSGLALSADAVLKVAVPQEACPLGLAPTASTTAALAMGDALAVVLLNLKQFKECDFRRNHPAGSLGERLKVNVAEVMLTGAAIPMVSQTVSLPEAIAELNAKNLGAVLIMREDAIIGILTDGDLRRLLSQNGGSLSGLPLTEAMTAKPKTITTELLAADALSIMQRHEITFLAVTDHNGRLAGVLHLQDLLGKGEFRFLV
ncbi:MAG: KpsF/GutQ family sugar-phosphate isomerase [Proteobacteria bacterium]|nr:KpsF/GutQ family sugar-phosphate isomerase [Pseudomonadota bacterium]MBU1547529.1 KpsF/GutQ family sugar-phosphate isomerase [Pseudomonadota bacterium]MBU2618601.1 KpsF/GutQ family sugar-phosphate isomerase [Pseudomonadota bacterium]